MDTPKSQKYILKQPALESILKIDYAKDLNKSQYAVVTRGDGPCLVLAGAGSGKTRTLIYRVAYLLEKGVHPSEIFLATFTNKAALEMRDRVETLVKLESRGLWCGTFHHIGNRILRQHAGCLNFKGDFGILDAEDSRDLIKSCIKILNLQSTNLQFPKPRVVQSILSFATNSRKPLRQAVQGHMPFLANFLPSLEKIKLLYEEKKNKTNNLDYDDLLLKWLELLQRSAEVREKLSHQFRYCLVDEYQDTNLLQNEIIRILSSQHKNILVVGDDAQSIYSFRAAEIKNILDFPNEYENAKLFKLETNYRSTKSILNLANESIKNNVHQFPKFLKSVHGEGRLPQLVRVKDSREEARFVAQRIGEFQEEGVELSEIAVLFRAHYQAAELEMELTKRGIGYTIRGGVRFFEQAHIKDVLSYLRILQNPLDELAWTRSLTLQPGIGDGFAGKIFLKFEEGGADLQKILKNEFAGSFPKKMQEGFLGFRAVMKRLLSEMLKDRPDLLIDTIIESGYNKHVLLNFENAQDRLEDLKELVNFAHTYKTLKSFLADAALKESFKGESVAGQADKKAADDNELILSTIHQAKGLEWRAVFIIHLSEGQFPHAKSMESENAVEEERRLFYVAGTRAKEDLILVHPMTRFDYNLGTVISRPSLFTLELPNDCYMDVEVEQSPQEETIYLDE